MIYIRLVLLRVENEMHFSLCERSFSVHGLLRVGTKIPEIEDFDTFDLT